MNLPARKPRFAAIPALIFAAGLGLVFHYGSVWYELPVYSPAEIEQSAELNLALEWQRAPSAATPEAIAARRDAIRAEVVAEIRRERDEARNFVMAGAVLLMVAAAQMLALRRFAAR